METWKHTKGYEVTTIVDGREEIVAETTSTVRARLIAAAPELLEAAKIFIEAIPNRWAVDDKTRHAFEVALRAIEKTEKGR